MSWIDCDLFGKISKPISRPDTQWKPPLTEGITRAKPNHYPPPVGSKPSAPPPPPKGKEMERTLPRPVSQLNKARKPNRGETLTEQYALLALTRSKLEGTLAFLRHLLTIQGMSTNAQYVLEQSIGNIEQSLKEINDSIAMNSYMRGM